MDLWGSHRIDRNWSLVPFQGVSPTVPADISSLASSGLPIFTIGRNSESRALMDLLPISGLADDFDNSSWQGLKAFPVTEIPEHAIVISCVSAIYPTTVWNRMRRAPQTTGLLSYRDLYLANATVVPVPSYGLTLATYRSNLEKLIWCRQAVASEGDLETLRAILNFRLSGEAGFLVEVTSKADQQYCHPMLRGPIQTLVDFGGFDGASAASIYEFLDKPRNVVIYEPFARHNAEIQSKFFEEECDVEVRNLAVSDCEAWGELGEAGRSSSHFLETLGGSVRQVPLGLEPFPEGLAVWKFDIEGAELNALRSAREMLKQGDIRLAVSVYHDPADLFLIVELVSELLPTARIGFGHYTEGWSESILYVVADSSLDLVFGDSDAEPPQPRLKAG